MLLGHSRPFELRCGEGLNGHFHGLCKPDGKEILPAKCSFLVSGTTNRWWGGRALGISEYAGESGQMFDDAGNPITPAMFSDYVDFMCGPDVNWGKHGEAYVKGEGGNGKAAELRYIPKWIFHKSGAF